MALGLRVKSSFLLAGRRNNEKLNRGNFSAKRICGLQNLRPRKLDDESRLPCRGPAPVAMLIESGAVCPAGGLGQNSRLGRDGYQSYGFDSRSQHNCNRGRNAQNQCRTVLSSAHMCLARIEPEFRMLAPIGAHALNTYCPN